MSAEYSSIMCKTALSPSKLPGLRYSLNPYIGCEHACSYCYVPSTLRDEWVAKNWGKFVRAKQNIADVLTHELRKKSNGVVGVSTVCDPYQPLEAKLELTRKCIELLSRRNFKICIQTKSSLVLRDKDVIKPKVFEVGVTITTMDGELSRELEPNSSPPDARAHVLEEFSNRDIETWLFLGPLIPEINDDEENIKRVVEVAKRTNSKLIYDKLNLRRWVTDMLTPVLEKRDQGLLERLPSLVKDSRWRKICSNIETICNKVGVRCEPAFSNAK